MPVCIIAISSYCLAVAIREFMKSVNGYPPPQGELILLNVTSVYPHRGKLGAPFWEAVEVYLASFGGEIEKVHISIWLFPFIIRSERCISAR